MAVAESSRRQGEMGAEKAFIEIFKPAFVSKNVSEHFDMMPGVNQKTLITLPEFKTRGFRPYGAPRSTETISGQPTIGQKYVDPENMTARLHFHPQDSFHTAYSNNVDPRDTGSYYRVFVEQMSHLIENDTIEVGWWGDKTLTSGTDYEFFKSINGLWKRLEIGVASDGVERIDISAQNGSTMSSANAVSILKQIKDKQPNEMYAMPNARKIYRVTRTMYDAYSEYLKNLGTEEAHRRIVDGYEVLMYDGLAIRAHAGWDKRLYETAGAANQHRAMLTVKDNLKVAGTSFGAGFKIWFSDDDDMWKSQSYLKMDTNYVHPNLTVVAY